MAKIEPKTLKGFRDFLPEQEIVRKKLIQKIESSFELFGFDPIETPVLEYSEILNGKYGEEGDKLMYQFKDHGEREVAMRYDLTIPLARVVAQYSNEIKKPWKRYQISPVWRADNTQKGRFREFYQCDADIVGTESVNADAEILSLSFETLQKIGLKPSDFVIRINSRKILDAFYTSINLNDDAKKFAIRTIDKVDKIGQDGVKEEFIKKDFNNEQINKILYFSSIKINSIEDFSELLFSKDPIIKNSLFELKSIIEIALKMAPEMKWFVDLSIARGLDYYTGLIFETNLIKAPQYGSVLSGGRYDNLIGIFSNKNIPAVGASVGLDRLIAALEELKIVESVKTVTKVLVANFDEGLEKDYIEITNKLRAVGLNTINFFGTNDLKKQLSYANEKAIRYVVIFGAEEKAGGTVTIKDLESGKQENIKINNLESYFA